MTHNYQTVIAQLEDMIHLKCTGTWPGLDHHYFSELGDAGIIVTVNKGGWVCWALLLLAFLDF